MAHRAAHDRRLSARWQHARGHGRSAALTALARGGCWLALALASCGGEAWNAQQWAETRPELRDVAIGRLGDATPYVLPSEDELIFFLCHWPIDRPVRVSLPPDANGHEREILDKALRAWEAVVTGLRFEVVDGTAPVRLRFRDAGPENANTAADCEVTPPFAGDPLRARMIGAQIELRRAERDPWGRPIELAANELLGSAVHELGHALGLQGHALRGKSALVRETSAVRRIGERLNDAKPKPLQEPAMQALYSLQSGTVIERRALAAGATREVDAIAQRAREQGAVRAVVRVGDRAAAVRWGPGRDLVYYLREPAELLEDDKDFEDALSVP